MGFYEIVEMAILVPAYLMSLGLWLAVGFIVLIGLNSILQFPLSIIKEIKEKRERKLRREKED
jgi:hypothetical protein